MREILLKQNVPNDFSDLRQNSVTSELLYTVSMTHEMYPVIHILDVTKPPLLKKEWMYPKSSPELNVHRLVLGCWSLLQKCLKFGET